MHKVRQARKHTIKDAKGYFITDGKVKRQKSKGRKINKETKSDIQRDEERDREIEYQSDKERQMDRERYGITITRIATNNKQMDKWAKTQEGIHKN